MRDLLLPPARHDGGAEILSDYAVPSQSNDARQPVPAHARIEWTTGAEKIDTYTVAWTTEIVLVQLEDRRHQLRGVWLAAADDRRRL